MKKKNKSYKSNAICMRCGQPSYPGCCEYAESLNELDGEKLKEEVHHILESYPFTDFSKIEQDEEEIKKGLKTFVKKSIEKDISHEGLVFIDLNEEEEE